MARWQKTPTQSSGSEASVGSDLLDGTSSDGLGTSETSDESEVGASTCSDGVPIAHVPISMCESSRASGDPLPRLDKGKLALQKRRRANTGYFTWSPALHRWVKERVGSRSKFCSIVTFLLLDASRRNLEEWSQKSWSINNMSMTVMTHVFTFGLALGAAMVFRGLRGTKKIFDVHYLWRWFLISAIMTGSFYLQAFGVSFGLDDMWVGMISYANVPFAIGLGIVAFQREYGRLELLAAALMTLGIGAFTVLRIRCVEEDCRKLWKGVDKDEYIGMLLVLIATLMKMVAWTGAEMMLKARSARIRSYGAQKSQVMWIMLAHMAFCQAALNAFIWIYHSLLGSQSILNGIHERPNWFGDWKFKNFALCFVYVLHMSLTFHIIKHFSTLSWALTLVVGGVLACCVSDPMLRKYHFERRAVPSLLIAGTIVLAAVIFQTGRLNILYLRSRLGIQRKPKTKASGWPDNCFGFSRVDVSRGTADETISPSSDRCRNFREGSTRAASTSTEVTPKCSSETQEKQATVEALARALEESSVRPLPKKAVNVMVQIGTYSSVIVYILSQALRENLSQKAQSNHVLVPQSLNVMTSLCGLVVANISTLWVHGRPGLYAAWDFNKICKFMFAALLFAVSAFLSSMAFALGASAAAKDAAGRVYTPAAALLSRWVLGKFYMWLEWLALIMLTLSCMAFGLLESSESRQSSSLAGLMCAVGSGVVSAVNSLVMERLMRKETDSYYMQSVRLMLGSLLFNFLFLFVMGWIGELEDPPREDFAFWAFRVTDVACAGAGSCDTDGQFILTAVEAPSLSCKCGRGIFVGWDLQWFVYGALASGVVYSWATGLVVKQFSSVYRSVADGIMLLIVYFFLTPLLDNTQLPILDTAKSMVVLMVPLSGTTFSYAASEMHKAMEVASAKNASLPTSTVADPSSDGDSSEYDEDTHDVPGVT